MWEVLQGLMCYSVVMGFMFALSYLPEVTVAIAQPLVPALALGMSAVLGIETLSYVSLGGIFVSIAGATLRLSTCAALPCQHTPAQAVKAHLIALKCTPELYKQPFSSIGCSCVRLHVRPFTHHRAQGGCPSCST